MTVRALLTAIGARRGHRQRLRAEGELPLRRSRPGRRRRSATEVERVLAAGVLANNAELVERDGQLGRARRPDRRRAEGRGAQGPDHRRPDRGALRARRRDSVLVGAQADEHGTRRRAPRRATGAVQQGRARRAARALHAGAQTASDEAALDADAARPYPAPRSSALAGEALRTLGLAYRRLPDAATWRSEAAEQGLVWLGVVGMIDPPRPEARGAVARGARGPACAC